MFGDDVRDEITSNILMESSYPRALTLLMCLCVGIIPLTKIPLNARPIVSTIEVLLGLHQQTVAEHSALRGRSMSLRGALKVAVRLLVVVCLLAISIAFPDFDSIMAFMGSALCFTICVTYVRSHSTALVGDGFGRLTASAGSGLDSLPLAFYLKLFGHEISAGERIFAAAVMVISAVLAVVGTVWAFLPKRLIGAAPSALLSR